MKIGIVGCMGRVGQLLVKELQSGTYNDLELVGGTVKADENYEEQNYPIYKNPDKLFKNADCVIDFTIPEATRKHIWLAAKHKTSLIIGTTGLTAEDEQEMSDASKETSIIYSANMSIGVNLLCALVEQAAARLDEEFDIEIVETHHKHKIDAPSGTALALGKAAAKGRNIDHDKKAIYERYGNTGQRNKGDIGYAVLRGGDVVGEHTIYFYGQGERIELTHKATDRSLFAKGALKAASWIKDKPTGLYSMKNVLNL